MNKSKDIVIGQLTTNLNTYIVMELFPVREPSPREQDSRLPSRFHLERDYGFFLWNHENGPFSRSSLDY